LAKKKKTIALTGYIIFRDKRLGKRPCTREGQDVFLSAMDYPRAVLAAGGFPVLYPPLPDQDYIRRAVETADGVILTGGAEIVEASGKRSFK